MHGVVATIDAGSHKPQSAVVAFSETDDLELIFGTFYDTRKFANILKRPLISFVIGWDDYTVQYEATAKILDGKEFEECRATHLIKNPSSKKYAYHEKQKYIKVTPQWIRYSDFSSDPERVFEITF